MVPRIRVPFICIFNGAYSWRYIQVVLVRIKLLLRKRGVIELRSVYIYGKPS